MGNLLLDASSPAIVWNGTDTTVISPSFTAPAGARIVVAWVGNTTSPNSQTVPFISGGGLSYTLLHHSQRGDGPAADGQCALWSAVSAGAAHTITVTMDDLLDGVGIKVWVWTDDAGGTPGIGNTKENGATSGSSFSDSVTATVANSRGVVVYVDWFANGTPTIGSGCTLTGGGAANQTPTLAYLFGLRSTADGVVGNAITMNWGQTAGSTAHRWVIAEVTPAGGAPAALVGRPAVFWWPGPGPFRRERFEPDPRAGEVSAVVASEVTITPADATWAAVAVTATPQPVQVTLTPAAATWAAVAVAPAPGATAVTLTPSDTTWAAQPVSPAAIVSLTPAIASWAAQPVVSTPAVPLTPATAVWAAVAVSPAPQPVAMTLTPAVGTWSAITVTPTPGATARTLTPATSTWAAQPVSPAPGATAVTLTPATATWTALQVALQTPGVLGALPATTTWAAQPVTPTPGQTARTITPATTTWTAQPVVSTPSTSLSPALSTWTARPLALAPGQTARTITPAVLTWQAVPVGVPTSVALVAAGSTWNAVPVSLAGAGEPGYIAGAARRAGSMSGAASPAGGTSATGGARIDGNAATAGKVDGHVL